MNVVTIRDALPVETAETARKLFMERQFAHEPFEDARHYSRNLRAGFGIPTADEIYRTDFHTAKDFPEIGEIIVRDIVPIARKAMNRTSTRCLMYCYKFEAGGHLRLHQDSWGGHTGFIWHLSKNWKWDWGGLMVAIDGEKATATLPVFNTLVLIDHAQRTPHLVTQVAPWAKEPRMVVTGIMQ